MSSSSASSSSPKRARSKRSPTSVTRPTFRACVSPSILSAASTPTSSWPSSIVRPRCRIRSRATSMCWLMVTLALWACARSCTSGWRGAFSPRVAASTLTWAKSPSACTCCTASRQSCSISTRPSPSSAAPSSKPRSCPTLCAASTSTRPRPSLSPSSSSATSTRSTSSTAQRTSPSSRARLPSSRRFSRARRTSRRSSATSWPRSTRNM